MVLTSQRPQNNNDDDDFPDRKPLEEGPINLWLLCPESQVTNWSMLQSASIKKRQMIKTDA